MPQSQLQPAPFRVPLLDEQGQLVETWRRFFLSSANLTNSLLLTVQSLGGSKPSAMMVDDPDQGDGWVIPGPIGPPGPPGLPIGTPISMMDGFDSVDDSWSLSGVPSPIGLFTQGSVIFAGPSGQLAQNNAKVFWDNTNFRLGIGTSVPVADLDVGGGGNGHIWVRAGTGGGLAASAGAGLKIEYDSVTDKGFLQAYNYATAATKFLILQAAGGFVGIGGIVTPTVPLDLTGDFRTTTQIRTPAIITDAGALTITPATGSGVNVVLSTTGDFAINTNQVYADTSTGFTGLGVTEPLAVLQVEGSTAGAVQAFIHNANGGTGSSAELNFGVWSGAIPTGTGNPGPSARIAAVNNNVGNAFANLVFSVYGVGGSATLSEVLRLQNTGLVCFSGATASFPALKRSLAALQVRLADDSGDASISALLHQTMTAIIAAGGGAAPTFTTIGGSGPATAAQNGWLQMTDSTGAAIFVPVWK